MSVQATEGREQGLNARNLLIKLWPIPLTLLSTPKSRWSGQWELLRAKFEEALAAWVWGIENAEEVEGQASWVLSMIDLGLPKFLCS